MFSGWNLAELSLIAQVDGPGCSAEEGSVLGYGGMFIWVPLCAYLMAGQFVICEEYFVPVLAALGDRWNMAEDVQGATLLAVGSSSPELFTAVLGIIFIPDDNPGPGTNVGSAVFNMCIIIGLSAIFAPKTVKLQLVPFLRDSISYMAGLLILYLFYIDGEMQIWESIALVLWWVIYVMMVYRTDLLAVRCCCCVPDDELDNTLKDMELGDVRRSTKGGDDDDVKSDYVALDDDAAYKKASYQRNPSVVKVNQSGQRGVLYDSHGHPVSDFDENPDNIRIAPGAVQNNESLDDDIQHLLDELNRKQRQNVNKGWVVVVIPGDKDRKQGAAPMHLDANGQSNVKGSHAFVRRRTLMETLAYEEKLAQQRRTLAGPDAHDDHDDHGHGAGLLHKLLAPWTKLFSLTLPAPESGFASNHIYLTIMAIVTWLGLLTFFVVDCSEKIGECLDIPGDLLGITLLAIGSSLPDCISSVIVARQAKIDMAVANAFGSNVFDVNLCVGFSYVLGSLNQMLNGETSAISLGTKEGIKIFSELIAVAAGFLVFLWLMMWCTIFRLEKWMGYVLIVIFVGYVCVFTVLFVQAADSEEMDVEEFIATTMAP